MKDFSQMSDEELAQMAYGKPEAKPAASQPDFASMGDDELFAMAKHGGRLPMPEAHVPKGVGEKAAGVGLWALDKVDSVTGAPTRAALDAAIDMKNPISAFAHQFLEDPSRAPTGKTIAEKLGVSGEEKTLRSAEEQKSFDEQFNLGWAASMKQMNKEYKPVTVTPSDGVGLLVDMGADWSNLVGTGLFKGGLKAGAKGAKATASGMKDLALEGAKMTAKGLAKGAAKATDVATASKVGTEALDSVSHFITPKIAEDYSKYLDIAKANNIDPSLLPASVEFGPDTFLSRAERNLAEGPIGEARLKRHNEAREAVQGALEKRVSDIAGGNVLDEVSAGQHLRDSFDRGVDKFFKGIDWTHNMVQSQAPGLRLTEGGAKALDSKLAGVEKFAKGRIDRGVTNTQKEQAKQLMAAVDAIRNSNGSYKQMYEAQQMIGDAAFKAKNSLADIPPDVEKLRDIYFAIDDALIDTTKSNLGDSIANRLVENNKAMSEFFGQKGVLSPVVGAKNMSNEQVFQSLVKNGDTRKIEALKKILPPEDIQTLKGAFLDSLTRRGSNGEIQLGNLRNQFQSKKNQIRALFSPEEVQGISQLVELGERMGPAVLSSSGTGASNAFRDLAKGVTDSVGSATVVDRLKATARGGAPETLTGIPAPKEIPLPQRFTQGVKDSFSAPLSPLADSESALKARVGAVGAKLGSTAQANEAPDSKLIEKIDANPRLLDTIKNPNLKRQLELAVRKRREERELQTFEKTLSPEKPEQPKDPRQSFIEGN